MFVTICILIASALLECGGDALIRIGLQSKATAFVAGSACLIAYGALVNQSRIDFGRLMAAYIAVFFLVSQAIAFFLFDKVPDGRTLVGCAAFIGGAIAVLA